MEFASNGDFAIHVRDLARARTSSSRDAPGVYGARYK
jgi:hypothetical protein